MQEKHPPGQRTIEVPFITDEVIEAEAMALLRGYGQRFQPVGKPPIPIDEILEVHLGLSLGFEDLNGRYGYQDVLGATWLDRQEVLIDESLDPDVHSRQEGRYHFTLGHEVGHWILHRPRLMQSTRQGQLFRDSPQDPPVVCRTSQKKERIELQADHFAAFLLMPKQMVLDAWQKKYNPAPFIYDPVETKARGFPLGRDEWFDNFAGVMCEPFKVSMQAMRIRLVELGLLLDGRGHLPSRGEGR